ncbi:hypothetical protein NMW32_19080 [Escherichia coli]|uniref:GA-like domain-containing protein n=1 Tax=Escherichia coli TaxID=562 RepID=UPI00224869B9|nr:hypothetical protein [Escherichia coli]MCX0120728.1 hypothetical protein [Escherichia coli]
MKMIFTGKVSGEKTVLAAGDRHTVKAQAGEQYGLVDEVTGLVPDGVEADRSGDDLILRKKEDDTEIRIEGFWEECQPGETQCTAVFNVVGENGQVTEAVLTQDGPVLENFTAGQSGTLAEGINNGIIWGGIAFGAGLAAIALAAGGGGGSSRHKSTAEGEQKPVQPEGGQETGKTDVSSTGSTKPESGNSSGQVPEVNDQDGNGKADAEEAAAAVAAATAAVEAAEAADQAAKDKLAELNADNLITPEEKAQLEAAKQNADTLKGEADSAVKALPDTAAEKGGLQDRVDALDGIQVPEVNDQDGNGKADAEEAAAAVAAATAAVEAAEAADQAAKDKLAELNADNLITPEEKAQLEAAKQNADTLKGEADSAVKALPDTAAEKGGLQDRVDALDGIQVPEVNDQDGNGKADAEEAAAAVAAARVFYEKAFSNVYQTGDLYAKTDTTSMFAPAATKLAKSTAQWTTILEKNAGAQMSQDQNAGGETRYIYNGSSGSDVITVGESFGGTGLNMAATRNDMKVMTGDGDDIIITGRDYGRLASSGQWDYKYLTEMGDGNDTLIVGASNSNLNVILFNDGSIGAVNKDNSQFGDVIPFDSAYDTSYGGQISGTTIDMGSGNDTVLALGYESGGTAVINATIKLGAGNDTIQIYGDVEGGSSPSVITGDAGMDTLIITNGSVFSEHFSGFEKIELGSKGEVKIVAKDLVGNDSNVIQGGMLKITGNSDSKVDLDGEWIKGETWNEGDITYTSYTHESAPGISVLIEDKITQII